MGSQANSVAVAMVSVVKKQFRTVLYHLILKSPWNAKRNSRMVCAFKMVRSRGNRSL
eukprot:SAG31_NODE_34494_length_332_cov_0.888412_1_plen_56_part_10